MKISDIFIAKNIPKITGQEEVLYTTITSKKLSKQTIDIRVYNRGYYHKSIHKEEENEEALNYTYSNKKVLGLNTKHNIYCNDTFSISLCINP